MLSTCLESIRLNRRFCRIHSLSSMSHPAIYIHLKAGDTPPEFAVSTPNRVVVIVEAEVTPEWQSLVSDWIVRSGCLYMMAWGANCSSWDDSVDIANLEEFKFGEIPEDRFIMTTWHSDESLAEVFWYAKNNALHPTAELEHTVLLHISARAREHELLAAYAEA